MEGSLPGTEELERGEGFRGALLLLLIVAETAVGVEAEVADGTGVELREMGGEGAGMNPPE